MENNENIENFRFGDFVREFRMRKGLSKPELAKEAEIPTTYVYDMEAGRIPAVKGDQLERLADALCLNKEERATFYELAELSWQKKEDNQGGVYEFKDYLHDRRTSMGLSLSELSWRAGRKISRTYIAKMEKGERPAPTGERLRWLAIALELDREEEKKFNDLAARSRNEVAEDIADTVNKDSSLRETIRAASEEKPGIINWAYTVQRPDESKKRILHYATLLNDSLKVVIEEGMGKKIEDADWEEIYEYVRVSLSVFKNEQDNEESDHTDNDQ